MMALKGFTACSKGAEKRGVGISAGLSSVLGKGSLRMLSASFVSFSEDVLTRVSLSGAIFFGSSEGSAIFFLPPLPGQ
jgi:hypothetical protein